MGTSVSPCPPPVAVVNVMFTVALLWRRKLL